MNDEDDEEHSFRIVDASELAAQQEAVMDKHRMQVDEFRVSVERFFDEMPPDLMFTFHRMMLHAGNARDPSMIHYWTGVSAVYLKKVHKICTMCGDHKHGDDEHFMAEMTTNESGPAEAGPSSKKLPDEALDKNELYERYNLEDHQDDQLGQCIRCLGCKTVFSSLEFRQQQGRDCPGCEARKSFDSTEG